MGAIVGSVPNTDIANPSLYTVIVIYANRVE